MLTINSIRIRNFRAIKELTFQPKEQGITGIFGTNGAGKTTILTAVMFALYGILPDKVPVSGLRRIKSDPNEECSVSVVFTHLNQKVEIIRELKGSSNRQVVTVYVNGQKESVTSVAAADRWMRKRLGSTPEGFLTAFVVRQKELDAFVQARPAERKALIEKLAGVEPINLALKKAREDEKDSRKTVDLLPGSQDQVDDAGAKVDLFTAAADEATEDLERTNNLLQALDSERKVLFRKIESLREKQVQLQQVQNKIANLSKEIPDLDQQLERVSYTKKVSETVDVDSLREEYQNVNTELSKQRETAAELKHSSNQLSSQIETFETRIDAESKRIKQLEETVEGTSEELSEEISSLTTRINAITLRVAQLQSSNADLEESLQMLHDNDDCPTCKTHLEDPEALRQKFQGIIKTNNEILNELADEEEELIVKISLLEQRKLLADELIQSKTNLLNDEQAVVGLREQYEDIPGKLTQLEDSIKTLTEKQEQVVELGSKARGLADDRKLFESLTDRKEIAVLDLEDARKQEKEITAEYSPKALQVEQNKFEQSSSEYEKLQRTSTDLTAKLTEARVHFQNARSIYQRAYDQWSRKKSLQEAHETKTLTTDMLEKFRHEMVASIAPEVSDYATALISEMTNGDFTELRLDENFQAYVTDAEGVEKPSSWLSGGEESVAALALRLAVAFLITGGNPELLWLDEPLTAQDKDRRAAILSVIRTLPINQILIINHAQEAQDIVDYEVTLKKGE